MVSGKIIYMRDAQSTRIRQAGNTRTTKGKPMSDLMNNCLAKIKKFFQEDDTTASNSRIESARITSNRLQALKRMRTNSPTTPDYKLEAEESREAAPTTGVRVQQKQDNIDLDFGMEIVRGKA